MKKLFKDHSKKAKTYIVTGCGMPVNVEESGSIVLSADFPEEEEGKICMYKMSPCTVMMDLSANDLYIAVPNGRSVIINNVAGGLYTLERL